MTTGRRQTERGLSGLARVVGRGLSSLVRSQGAGLASLLRFQGGGLANLLRFQGGGLSSPPGLLLLLLFSAPVLAQPDASKVQALREAAVEAFGSGDLDLAGERLAELVELEPDNFVHRYNLACVRSRLGKGEAAAELLLQAVEHGFTDVHLLRRDPSLRAARETSTVRAMLENWEAILERRIETDLERARERYGGRYRYEKDPELRLAYACAYDETTLEQVRAELRAIHAWAMEHVFAETDADDALVSPDDPWVLVVMPTQEDFRAWAAEHYGAAARNFNQAIGGHYAHDEKQLVTIDLGSTLRHEFMHVLHWRSNARRGQSHPIWVQEGLCSLIEDYDRGPSGELLPAESWRTNQARFLAETGNLLDLRDLTSIDRRRFTSSRPLAMYAQARALFLFLEREDALAPWYARFSEHFGDDPTGLDALIAVLAGEEALADQDARAGALRQINRRYAQFCRTLPEVPEEIRRGMASLGVTIDATGAGEGLRVAAPVRRGVAGDLRLGDIITHIDGRPVRDYWELVRVLTSYEPGQTVTVNYRRVRLHRETEVELKAAG
jgi:hypothetical protein